MKLNEIVDMVVRRMRSVLNFEFIRKKPEIKIKQSTACGAIVLKLTIYDGKFSILLM